MAISAGIETSFKLLFPISPRLSLHSGLSGGGMLRLSDSRQQDHIVSGLELNPTSQRASHRPELALQQAIGKCWLLKTAVDVFLLRLISLRREMSTLLDMRLIKAYEHT